MFGEVVESELLRPISGVELHLIEAWSYATAVMLWSVATTDKPNNLSTAEHGR